MAPEAFMHNAGIVVIYPWRLVWAIAGIGLSSIFWNEKMREHWDFWVGFPVFSFLSICPGFYFYLHYLVTLLPAVAMLSGIAVSSSMAYLSKRFSSYSKIIPVIFIIVALVLPAWQQKRFFCASPIDASRMLYRASNTFPESLTISEYIRNHSSEKDTVAVLGSEPQIYFYANRKSATGYIYVYGLMESQPYASQMQKEMIREIESAQPKYIVFVNEELSWLIEPNSDRHIFLWSEKYLTDHYLLSGVMNTMSDLRINTNINSQDTGLINNYNLSILVRKQQ
jgi:hypothetical protein